MLPFTRLLLVQYYVILASPAVAVRQIVSSDVPSFFITQYDNLPARFLLLGTTTGEAEGREKKNHAHRYDKI